MSRQGTGVRKQARAPSTLDTAFRRKDADIVGAAKESEARDEDAAASVNAAATGPSRHGSGGAASLLVWKSGDGCASAQSRPPIDYPNVACSRASIVGPVKPCHSVHSVLPALASTPTCAARTGRRRLEGMDATCGRGQELAGGGPARPSTWHASFCRQGRRQHGGDKRRTCVGRGVCSDMWTMRCIEAVKAKFSVAAWLSV